MATKGTVEKIIADNDIVIFSKSYCPFCKQAKGILNSEFPEGQIYITELDEITDGGAIQSYLEEKTGQRTVPNIFINKRHVGGCDSVVALQREGKLAGLIAA